MLASDEELCEHILLVHMQLAKVLRYKLWCGMFYKIMMVHLMVLNVPATPPGTY